MTANKSRGSALVAVMVLLVIAALTLQMTRKEQLARSRILQAISWSNALQQVCYSADTYATRNWSTVVAQPTTVLTMANLTGVPPLTSDVVATLSGIAISASVTMSPIGCDPVANQCRSDVRVWTGALPGTSVERDQLSNAIVQRIGDLSSLSLDANPAQFVSRNSARIDPNPSGVGGAVLVRCGEVNIASNQAGMRGNAAMTGALNAGGNNLKFPDLDTAVVQINLAPGAGCTTPNQFALDAAGRYMYCDGSTWLSAAKPITQVQTINLY